MPYESIPYESTPTYSVPSDYYTPGAEPTPAPQAESAFHHLPPTSTAVQPTLYEAPVRY